MKFGIFGGGKVGKFNPLGDSYSYQDFVKYICCADRLGFEGVFLVEHHFTGTGQLSASLNLLTYVAAKTQRIRLGTAVVVLPWHNPVLLAEQIATLDLLSGGRVDVGVGRGYRKEEFAAFCIPMDQAQARFEECLALMRKSWTSKERFSHHSPLWNFEDIVVEPNCIQKPHPPIWMAAGSAPGIRHVAGQGFNLLLDHIASIDEIVERVAVYKEAQEAAGIRPDASRVGVARALHIIKNEAERAEALERRRENLKKIGDLAKRPAGAVPASHDDPAMSDAALIGTKQEVIDRLGRLAEGGVEYVLLTNVTATEDSLEMFVADIAPHVAHIKAQPAARETAKVA